MNCLTCGTQMTMSRESVKYDDAGLPGVTLQNVEVSRCPACGDYEVALPKLGELHRVLAGAIASKRGRLVGDEVRFLRKFLGLSASDFARVIDVHPSTVSRWENGKEPIGIGKVTDRLLRALVIIGERDHDYPIQSFSEVAQDEEPQMSYVIGASDDGGWQPEAATG